MTLRRTAITRKKSLARRTPMPRGKAALGRRATKTIARQRRDSGPSDRERMVVRDRAGGRCELCGVVLHDGASWVAVHSVHHRLPRGMGGSRRADVHAPYALLLLCGSGTTGCHGRVESNREAAYAAGTLVRQSADPATVPVIVWAYAAAGRVLLTADGDYLLVAA